MRKISLSFLLIALATVTASSQKLTVEQGKLDELRGVTKIYVEAANPAARQNIIKEINKALPNLILTATPNEAEVWILFKTTHSNSTEITTVAANPALTSSPVPFVNRSLQISASGAIFKPIAKDRIRNLLDFKDSAESSVDTRLSANFAREFVKLYRKANR